MFDTILAEINTFPLTDQQKKYIETVIKLAYDKGCKEGINKSLNIENESEEEDLSKTEDKD